MNFINIISSNWRTFNENNQLYLRGEIKIELHQAEQLGMTLAQALIKQGADKILREVYQQLGDDKKKGAFIPFLQTEISTS